MTGSENIDDLDWCYLGEGNSSIVYSSVGQNKWVLRVKKHYQTDQTIKKGDGISALENDKIYVERVLKPLFKDHRYFISTDIINLSEEMKERLKDIALTTNFRPDERRFQSFLFDSSAMLMPHLGFYESVDLASISSGSYAVEIKPKWGFLPKMTSKLPGQIQPYDFTVCRFCVCQHLKVKNGKISSISPYCPLELFANCSCRLKRALHSLFQEPQNNLRVFHNGMLIYSGLPIEGVKQNIQSLKRIMNDISSKRKGTAMTYEALISIIASIFIHDSWQGLESQCKFETCTATSTPICKRKQNFPLESSNCFSLGPISILKRLVTLQKIGNVDASSIKRIIEIIKERDLSCTIMEKIGDYASQQWENFVSRMIEGKINDENGSTEELINTIQSFLVSATFKDCSIMITFREKLIKEECRHEENIVNDCISNAVYAYSIKLIDLDPKPLKKMDYYEQMDHDILTTYKKHFSDDVESSDF